MSQIVALCSYMVVFKKLFLTGDVSTSCTLKTYYWQLRLRWLSVVKAIYLVSLKSWKFAVHLVFQLCFLIKGTNYHHLQQFSGLQLPWTKIKSVFSLSVRARKSGLPIQLNLYTKGNINVNCFNIPKKTMRSSCYWSPLFLEIT